MKNAVSKDDPNFSENKAIHPNYIYQLAITFEQ